MLDSGARGSTTTFAQRGIGDVLLSWENEAYLALNELGKDKVEVVTPSDQHPGRTAGQRGGPDRGQTRHHRSRQSLSSIPVYAGRAGDRARAITIARVSPAVAAKYADRFPKVNLFTIDELFGGWQKAQKRHFDDGGVFDKIYHAGAS